MDEFLVFGSGVYWLMLGILVTARGMDVLSTWVATPNLVLEGNPVAKLLGWRWGLPVNFGMCLLLAFWPLPAIVLGTTSVLVAARNFQSAWLMRSMGEDAYREWHVARIQETRITLYLLCLAGNTLLTAAIGGIVIWFNNGSVVLLGIGAGIAAYGGAVAFYTMLALWRMRRAGLRTFERPAAIRFGERSATKGELGGLCLPEELQGK
ncbi:MAG TPA: hypothetical protein VLT36_03365 [Candidatus Dormibacteraeota bacterium]|nr:hypothetical protein [Candidatus Dormibacteraeota bacterium]